MACLASYIANLSKVQPKEAMPDMDRVAAIILGGGEGSRLFPLTKTRCKPAITFGGGYRLIDIPISNSIHSGCDKIFVLTQYLSASLHHHIFKTYRHDHFHKGFVELLSAEQRFSSGGWFKGTADAVRQNLEYLREVPVDYFLILSGDQLYSMDYREMLKVARDTDADLVVGTMPVEEKDCKRFGILKMDAKKRLIDFIEKPQSTSILRRLRINPDKRKDKKEPHKNYLASMGIYLFKREALFKLLTKDSRHDFGQHLIPAMIEKGKAAGYLFNDYWEDIGTIASFYEANMALTKPNPPFNCYDEKRPIYSLPLSLPGPKISNALIKNSTICEGAVIEADEVTNSILGPRAIVREGTIIRDSYIMGSDYYRFPIEEDFPEPLEIGEDCIITKAIIDKNSSIGSNVRLINKNRLNHYDADNIYIRDGIIVVPRGAIIPDGFVL